MQVYSMWSDQQVSRPSGRNKLNVFKKQKGKMAGNESGRGNFVEKCEEKVRNQIKHFLARHDKELEFSFKGNRKSRGF